MLRALVVAASIVMFSSPVLAQERSIVPEPPVGWTRGGPVAPVTAYPTRVAAGIGVFAGLHAIAKGSQLQAGVVAGVGLVAADVYYAPKNSIDGCTIRAHWVNSDFNSPPRLLQYRNYLPPLPATHPPITMPSVLSDAVGPDTRSLGSVKIEY